MTLELVSVRGIQKSFARLGEGDAGFVLRGIDLDIAAGDTHAIVGPSGSGKSTLLAILGGLEPPDTGSVLWQGRDLFALEEDDLCTFRNRELGFVFQAHHLMPQLSALENALLPALVPQRAHELKEREVRARSLLSAVGLGARLEHRPGELSGGERSRVALARALVNGPRLVLADEPTGSLDAQSADELADLLIALNQSERVALVVVTHSERLAARMGRVHELAHGMLHAR